MTREEFEQYAKENGLVVWSKEQSERAMQALEQEVVAENATSDCISRQAVWDVMQWMWGESGELLDELMALPSVIPKQEPKTGHWIENEKQTHVEKIYHCSECGFEAWGEWERTNYCGGCGARMSEVKQ